MQAGAIVCEQPNLLGVSYLSGENDVSGVKLNFGDRFRGRRIVPEPVHIRTDPDSFRKLIYIQTRIVRGGPAVPTAGRGRPHAIEENPRSPSAPQRIAAQLVH